MATEYIYSANINQLFRDKDTGEPLVFGKIFFYKDKDRTTLKPVYKQTGSPGSYTYTEYETNTDGSVPLNAYGALDHALYLYPFDESGNEELYYLIVKATYANVDVVQFDREGFPLIADNSGPSTTGLRAFNYIFNGQFLVHDIIGASGQHDEGEIRASLTDIAPGEWIFQRDVSTTARDYVLFTRFNQYDANVPANPRYSVNVKCNTSSSGENIKRLLNRFNSVNFFSSSNGSLTFSFYAKSNNANQNVNIKFYRYFGVGGSEEETINVGSETITTDWKQFVFTFNPGATTGKNIGSADDDFSEIQIELPLNTTFDFDLTNFLLYEGKVTNPEYEETRPLEVLYQSQALLNPGTIREEAGETDYGFWMLCDGRAVSRITYYKLFQRIGTIYGNGDGSTTFNIPDIRGRISIGSGSGSGLTQRLLGQKGGNESKTLVADNLPPHTHKYTDPVIGNGAIEGDNPGSTATKFPTTNGGTTELPTTPATAFDVMNPFIVFNKFIYTGVI